MAVRGTWNPYYANEGRHVLHFGSSVVFTDDQDNVVRFRNRPEVHEGVRFIDTGNLAVSDYHRYNTEAALVWGSASLQSELYYTTTNGIAGLPDQEFYGAYVFGSYFLTGEHRPYRRTTAVFDRVTPLTNFWVVDSDCGTDVGWGAWELVARWSMSDLDDPFLAGRGAAGKLHNVTTGFNWYWNPYTRYMFNWIHAMGDRNDVGDNDADILAMRLQVDF